MWGCGKIIKKKKIQKTILIIRKKRKRTKISLGAKRRQNRLYWGCKPPVYLVICSDFLKDD